MSTKRQKPRALAIRLVGEVQELKEENRKLQACIEELRRCPVRHKMADEGRIARSTRIVVGERKDRDVDHDILPRVMHALGALLKEQLKDVADDLTIARLHCALRDKLGDMVRSQMFERVEGDGMSAKVDLGFFPDGRPGELFVRPDRSERGDVVGTLCNWGATMTSMLFQYHVPSEAVISKLELVRDVTEGWVHMDGETHKVSSFLDGLAKWMRRVIADKEWTEDAIRDARARGLIK